MKFTHWPILDFTLVIPFVSLRTGLMHFKFEEAVLEYVVLFIKIYKWEFKFRLYKPKRFV